MKKKGKPDPYACVPLSHGNLNRRKSAKSGAQWSTLVKGVKKGAKTGKKAKNHEQLKKVKKLMKNMSV